MSRRVLLPLIPALLLPSCGLVKLPFRVAGAMVEGTAKVGKKAIDSSSDALERRRRTKEKEKAEEEKKKEAEAKKNKDGKGAPNGKDGKGATRENPNGGSANPPLPSIHDTNNPDYLPPLPEDVPSQQSPYLTPPPAPGGR